MILNGILKQIIINLPNQISDGNKQKNSCCQIHWLNWVAIEISLNDNGQPIGAKTSKKRLINTQWTNFRSGTTTKKIIAGFSFIQTESASPLNRRPEFSNKYFPILSDFLDSILLVSLVAATQTAV